VAAPKTSYSALARFGINLTHWDSPTRTALFRETFQGCSRCLESGNSTGTRKGSPLVSTAKRITAERKKLPRIGCSCGSTKYDSRPLLRRKAGYEHSAAGRNRMNRSCGGFPNKTVVRSLKSFMSNAFRVESVDLPSAGRLRTFYSWICVGKLCVSFALLLARAALMKLGKARPNGLQMRARNGNSDTSRARRQELPSPGSPFAKGD